MLITDYRWVVWRSTAIHPFPCCCCNLVVRSCHVILARINILLLFIIARDKPQIFSIISPLIWSNQITPCYCSFFLSVDAWVACWVVLSTTTSHEQTTRFPQLVAPVAVDSEGWVPPSRPLLLSQLPTRVQITFWTTTTKRDPSRDLTSVFLLNQILLSFFSSHPDRYVIKKCLKASTLLFLFPGRSFYALRSLNKSPTVSVGPKWWKIISPPPKMNYSLNKRTHKIIIESHHLGALLLLVSTQAGSCWPPEATAAQPVVIFLLLLASCTHSLPRTQAVPPLVYFRIT